MAGRIVLFRPFPFQKSLRLSVAFLLAQIGANRVAAMMPNHGRRTETQRPSLLLQPPTNIHVVARHPELRIKPSDSLEARLAERHVAARDVFRFPIRKQNVRRTSG